jgi:predicted PhzF superfamily epimerase YddE/YHI9
MTSRQGDRSVQLDKSMILDLLRERGQQDQATQAEQQLPDQVDTDQHAGLLQQFGLDPQELIQKFMGGGGLPKF